MNDNEVIEAEVLPPEVETKLVKFSSQTGLANTVSQTLFEAFRPIFVKARDALSDSIGVAESVKDATCVREIMRSRACRLALRKVRLEGDEVREKHKKDALLYGKAVQGFYNILLADLSPVETALQEAEDIAERAEAKRLTDLKAARETELVPLLDEPLLGNLADLSESDYMKKLSNAKLLRQAKLDAAAKAKAEHLAKAEADRIERERIAAENERLKAEVEAREAAYKAERAEAARLAKEAKAKSDEVHRKELAEQTERVKVELAAVEARAKAEAVRIAEIAAKEKVESDAMAKRAAEEIAAARAALAEKEKAEAADAARVEAERKAAAAAAKKAAAAPDKAKLAAFAVGLRSMTKPELTNKTTATALRVRIDDLARWCETEPIELH